MTFFVDLENHYINQLRETVESWKLPKNEHIFVGSFGDKMTNLPKVVVEATGITSGGLQWTDKISVGMHFSILFPYNQYGKYRLHRDPTNTEGLLRAILELEKDGLRMDFGDLDRIGHEDNPMNPKTVDQVWSAHIEGYRTYQIPRSATFREPAVNDPRYPPDMSDFEDLWGIAVEEDTDILYFTQGNPGSAEDADIHSIDLTTNDRRMPEISAGVVAGQFHHGLEAKGVFLWNVVDGGPAGRGQWYLHSLNSSNNTLLRNLLLGYGTYTGAALFEENGEEYVSVSEDYGSGTRHVPVPVDLRSPLLGGDTWVSMSGEAAGAVIINNRYRYDIVGSTAICFDRRMRRPHEDIYLGPDHRTQWHDCTRRGNYLWVSGTHDDGSQVRSLISSFRIPDSVLAN